MTLLLIAAFNWQNDGLWFQGDAPRHATNGLFWWDLLQTAPWDPIDFTLRYYARYPVISPATYPPLFYIVEGLSFAVVAPSPYVAKVLVLLFAGVAGLYTMAWARRWIGPSAGWAGAFLAFVPGMVLWSNAVMLNVPATALGLAALYHFRSWLETARARQLVLTVLCSTAVLLTYYQGAVVLCIGAAWVLLRGTDRAIDRRPSWFAAGALCALIPIVGALVLAPVQTSRHLPSLAMMASLTTWTFYWKTLPDVVGGLALALGLVGAAAGLLIKHWRGEAAYVIAWVVILIVSLSLLPAKDGRYILLAAPAFVIAAAIGIAAFIRYLPPLHPGWQATALATGLAVGCWSAASVRVPQVSGFREIAAYLQEQAPHDAVLYDGAYDGLFGFYVRAMDPHFERRVARADKLVYQYGPTTTFEWAETSNVSSTEDVVTLLRRRLGCRWVAIEVGRGAGSALGRRMLRQAVARPEFELVRSFPITGAGVNRRVDLYRLTDDVDPVTTVDLSFPAFDNRVFPQIVPITR